MNIFLTSSFADVADLFVAFTQGECRGKRVTLIPTASLAEEVNAYLIAAKDALVEAGLVVDELEVSTASREEIVGKLERNDYIYVAGGNTFFLLQELKRTGADKLIAEQVRSGKCYIGESAGSAVLAPSIEYLQRLDDPSAAPDLDSFASLALIDFYPLPHYGNEPFKQAVEQVLIEYGDTLDLRPFSNYQAIAIVGNEVEVQTSAKSSE
ncbi:Type 1 glutamine amidotransferase-like domain-containing protein [Pseudomonas sp. NPDC077382]